MNALQLDRGKWSGLALVGLIVACSGAAYGARIVHSPNEALAAGVNGAVDSRGARWTVYGRSQANDGTTQQLAGQAVVSATPTAKGLGSYDGWCFVVATAETEEKPISGLGSKPVRPGDLVYHPANTTRVALRFTPPRNGRYSFSAQFYTINPGLDGHVDATVLFNGAALMQEQVWHNGGQGSASSLCSRDNLFLTTEDSLEFVVGPGFDNNNGCDSTALSLSIVEEGTDSFEALAQYDANAAMATLVSAEPYTGTCTAEGATWSLFGSSWNSWRMNVTTTWNDYYDAGSLPMAGPLAKSWEDCPTVARKDDEWCRLAVNVSGGPFQSGTGTVGPNEMLVHAGANHYPMIRFSAPVRGTYLVTAVASHVASTADYTDGIVLGVMAGGDQIAWANVNCKESGTKTVVLQSQTPILYAGETIDCVIHPGEHNYSDASVLSLKIVRLADAAWKGFDLGDAVTGQFKEKGVTTGSFVDANGGTWSTGWMAAGANELNAFSPQTGSLNDGNLQGVTYDGATSWVYLLANMTGAPLAGWFNRDVWPERSVMQPNEIVLHPGADKDPVLRFQVPARGYYNITLHLRDIQPMNKSEHLGVTMALVKNGREALSNFWAGWWRDEWSCFESSIRLKDIYLKPSDRLDFRLNCDGDNGGDLTALRGWIVPSGKKDDVYKPGLLLILR